MSSRKCSKCLAMTVSMGAYVVHATVNTSTSLFVRVSAIEKVLVTPILALTMMNLEYFSENLRSMSRFTYSRCTGSERVVVEVAPLSMAMLSS